MAATSQVRLLVWSDSCLRNIAPMPNVMPHGGTTKGQCWVASPKALRCLLPVACFAIPEGFLMLRLRPPSFRASFPMRLLRAMTKCLE